MKLSAEKIDSITIHFVLCTERTGSSLLSLMLNLNKNIICASEEPFALYLNKRYHKKHTWTKEDVSQYVDDFFLIADKNLALYFSEKEIFKESLLNHLSILNWHRVIKLTYLHFIDIKDKSNVKVIIDKQIKYFFHLGAIQNLFPNAKYLILTRDVRDNVVSKKRRKLNWNQQPLFLASLWKSTYRNRFRIPISARLILKYEDFVSDTEKSLKKVCDWFQIEFNSTMMKTEGVYEKFIDAKKSKIPDEFLSKLNSFHSGLSSKPNSEKIGQYKEYLNQDTALEIEAICKKEFIDFEYELSKIKNKKLNPIKRYYYMLLANCYRKYLLKFYYYVPLGLKLYIRKKGRNNIDV